MPQVVPDFIPAIRDKSPAIKEALEAQQRRSRGQGFRDFIPGPNHVKLPPSGSKASHKEALDRAMARQSSAARDDYAHAVQKLKDLTVMQAVEFIRQLPYAVMEMTLVAETLNGHRKSILQAFPEVDPETVAKWKEINAGSPAEQASPAVVSSTAGDAEE